MQTRRDISRMVEDRGYNNNNNTKIYNAHIVKHESEASYY